MAGLLSSACTDGDSRLRAAAQSLVGRDDLAADAAGVVDARIEEAGPDAVLTPPSAVAELARVVQTMVVEFLPEDREVPETPLPGREAVLRAEIARRSTQAAGVALVYVRRAVAYRDAESENIRTRYELEAVRNAGVAMPTLYDVLGGTIGEENLTQFDEFVMEEDVTYLAFHNGIGFYTGWRVSQINDDSMQVGPTVLQKADLDKVFERVRGRSPENALRTSVNTVNTETP